MVSETQNVTTESAKDTVPVENVDEELKKIYNQMKMRVPEVPAYAG